MIGASSACATSGAAVGSVVAAALQFFAASQCLVQEPWPSQDDVPNGSSFDFIIVGAGTAGSVLAARLTENYNFTVLLLEAGGDPPQESIIPGFRDAMKYSPYDWNFTTVNDHFSSQAHIGGRQKQPRGKMLGGSGSINDMIYARGFPVDYEEWASIGPQWQWNNVLDYFKKTEHLTDERILKDPELVKYHGFGGEIEVGGLEESTHDTNSFLGAFQEVGFKIVADMTSPDGIGAGRYSHTIRDGHRDSSLTALLNKAGERGNLFVLKEAFVTQVLMHNETAYGVKVTMNDKELHFHVKKEVIISAGTFNTPKLLLLSGIGPRDYLEHLNIPLVQDLPVGDNLHDHAMVLNYIVAENGTCYTDHSSQYMSMIKYLYDRSGPLSISNSMGAYISLNASAPNVPDIAIYPTCLPINSNFYESCINILGFKDEICSKLYSLNKDYELLTFAAVLLKPKSRGKVRLNSTDYLDEPLIYSGTFNNPEDMDGFPKVVEVIKSIAATSYFKRLRAQYVDFDLEECQGLEDIEKVKCTAQAMVMSAWHAVGTAAMGSVVDSTLKVKGVTGLRVVDASVMPKVIRGNTNAPVVMIAEQAADFIKADYEYKLNKEFKSCNCSAKLC